MSQGPGNDNTLSHSVPLTTWKDAELKELQPLAPPAAEEPEPEVEEAIPEVELKEDGLGLRVMQEAVLKDAMLEADARFLDAIEQAAPAAEEIKTPTPNVDRLWDDMLLSVSQPTRNAVWEQGFQSVTEVTKFRREDLLKPKGPFNNGQLDELAAWLKQHGLGFKVILRRKPQVPAGPTNIHHLSDSEMQDVLRLRAARFARNRELQG